MVLYCVPRRARVLSISLACRRVYWRLWVEGRGATGVSTNWVPRYRLFDAGVGVFCRLMNAHQRRRVCGADTSLLANKIKWLVI